MFKLHKPKQNFTIISNDLLRDKRLSLRAKGLYALMFSKPQDWVFYEGALVQESSEGRDAVRSTMKELLDTGWISKSQPRGEGGLLSHAIVRLHVTADWKSGDGSTADGEPAPIKTDKTKTEEPIPPTPKGEPDGFEDIWKAVWKRGGGSQPRQPAARAYASAIKSGAKHEVILAAVKARIGVDKPDTVYAPMLSTWLNQRRWENEGAEPVMSAADLDAANRRLEERQKKHREQMAQLAEQRSNQLLGRVS